MDRPTPSPRVVPAVRPPRPVDAAGVNERFLRRVLALVSANAEHRTNGGSYGEVTIKIKWSGGKITDARFVEETTLKPDE